MENNYESTRAAFTECKWALFDKLLWADTPEVVTAIRVKNEKEKKNETCKPDRD